MGKTNQDTIRKVADKGLDAVEEKVLDGLDATRKVAEEAAEQTAEIKNQTEIAVKEFSQVVSAYVQEKPLQAAGIAFAAGVLTTLILSRR